MSAIKTKPCRCCGGNGRELAHREVGAEMRRRRIQSGKSLIQVSKLMKVSVPYLSDLELGKRNWRRELLDRFALAIE